MNRRQSIKAIGITSLTTSLLLEACDTEDKEIKKIITNQKEQGREDREIERNEKLNSEKFFTDHEMKTITVLADIIIPRDEFSGNASDAKVPDFIEFIVKDRSEHQLPMRGGLKWLDMQCLNHYAYPFIELSSTNQLTIISEIAYPAKAKPEMLPGVAFFNMMRNLTASGFYTTKMGIEDLGYKGNSPGPWEGVPVDELTKYGLLNM